LLMVDLNLWIDDFKASEYCDNYPLNT
jgi:hypothetical protein